MRSRSAPLRSSIPIGEQLCVGAQQMLVGLQQALLQVPPRRRNTAGQADDTRQIAVQRDNALMPGAFVQPVDVLRDQSATEKATLLQLRKPQVPHIRFGPTERGPTVHATRPVALTRGVCRKELADGDRRRAFVAPVAVAVVADTRCGAQTRTAQHEQARGAPLRNR